MTAPQPRYFYTDPLAAAWMAKHFGMVFGFQRLDGTIVLDEDLIHPLEFEQVEPRHWRVAKFIVHPDSLYLLSAQAGDLVTLIESQDTRIAGWLELAENSESEQVMVQMNQQGSAWSSMSCQRSNLRVFQRNGIAFHWPESEAA